MLYGIVRVMGGMMSKKVVKERVEVPLHLYLVEQSEPIVHHNVDTQTDTFILVSYYLLLLYCIVLYRVMSYHII
jgi:hypothetical protein